MIKKKIILFCDLSFKQAYDLKKLNWLNKITMDSFKLVKLICRYDYVRTYRDFAKIIGIRTFKEKKSENKDKKVRTTSVWNTICILSFCFFVNINSLFFSSRLFKKKNCLLKTIIANVKHIFDTYLKFNISLY